MSSQENIQQPKGDFETHPHIYGSTDMESLDFEKLDPEYHLANETLSTPRSMQSSKSVRSRASSETLDRPKVCSIARSKVIRPQPHSSSIPLPMKLSVPIKPAPKSSIKIPINKPPTPTSRLINNSANRHTLEIQYINKNKRFLQLKKELLEKQKPVIEMYRSLTTIKKKLQQLGKNVKLDEVKLVPYQDFSDSPPGNTMMQGAGEQISLEVVNTMKSSIEEIPKTLMDICQNLLSRRALIVELLESVTKSELDVGLVSDKITSLKCEGQQLQQSLDMVIKVQEIKICELVENWQKLLCEKQSSTNDVRIEELENKLKEEQKSKEDSENVIRDLHKKMDERKSFQDKSLAEMNGVVNSLKEQIKKLDQDLESERKATVEFKSRNSANAQTLKNLRARVNELENQSSDKDSSNADLQKKIKLMQDQMKHKEALWGKEKDDMAKNLKHQEHLLQKLTADKNRFETRLQTVEEDSEVDKGQMQEQLSSITDKLLSTQAELEKVTLEKNEAVEKCKEFEHYITRMSVDCKETMNKVSCSIEWGNASRHASTPEAENYMQTIVKDMRIIELEDKLSQMQEDKKLSLIKDKSRMDFIRPSIIDQELEIQKDLIKRYQLILEDGEKKLKEKLQSLRNADIGKLNAQIRELKLRQDKYEDENGYCSIQELNRMLEEGRQKLTEVVQRYVENDDKVQNLKALIETQKTQMNDMGNLLKYHENITKVLKSNCHQLMSEKNSLARYSKEVKTILIEVSTQSTKKDEKLKYLEQKIATRETDKAQLESDFKSVNEKLQIANDRRYKLQDTISKQEKELQINKEKIEKLKSKLNKTGGNSSWGFLDSVYEVIEDDKPNKKIIKHYSNSLMPGSNNSNFKNEPATKTQSDKFCCPHLLNRNKTSSHCYPVKSSTLLGHSLQTIDVVTTRLNFLTSVTAESLLAYQDHLDWDSDDFKTHFKKIFKLATHRYNYLQTQAQESYQDLSNLLKFAITQTSSTQTK